MGPEERADKIIAAIGSVSALDDDRWLACQEMVVIQIKAAIREAYESAAKIAENVEVTLTGDDPFGNQQIADAIRARADSEEGR